MLSYAQVSYSIQLTSIRWLYFRQQGPKKEKRIAKIYTCRDADKQTDEINEQI